MACDNLTVAYGDHVAAQSVTFDVQQGEIFGLLGPNGAGKTSVIRALTTILEPASGSATIAGAALTDDMAVRSAIGVLPESNGYPSDQTGPAYLRYFAQLFGQSRNDADTRAKTLLDQLGLAGVNSPIGTYSRGMRQRLGLCRALINRPEVLFLDEPTLGLDPAGKDEIVSLFAEIALNDGVAVILCTHLLDEVERVCDRVAILDHGHMIIDGTVPEVIEAASLGGLARIQVAVDDMIEAHRLLTSHASVKTVKHDNTRPGDLDLTLDTEANNASSAALSCLTDAGIDVHGFDRSTGSLNDAFLALTATRPHTTESSR